MKKIKSIKSIVSDLKLTTKSTIISVLAITASLTAVAAMIKGIYSLQEEKHIEIQKTIVAASEQIMEMTVENSVNIAKSIYTDQTIYNFLDTEYNSAAEYYDAFYNLQNNNPMTIAESPVINRCTLYTENPSVMTGGDISSFNPVLETDWYHAYKKLNKKMILYVDNATGTLSIIRRLDFYTLKTGDSCIKLDLNMSMLKDYCDALDFNGEIYIINGGSIIYSSVPDAAIENIKINPDFECYIKNYYTSDIEYYACEKRIPVMTFVRENLAFIIVFLAALAIMIITEHIFVSDIKKRLCCSADQLVNEKEYIKRSSNGSDEIGKFIDVCIDVAERLAEYSSDFIRTNEEIQQNNSRYNQLLETAMRLDAELYISEKYHNVYHMYSGNIPLDVEIKNISHVTHNITSSVQTDLGFPAYSLMMIADDLSDTSLSVDVQSTEDNTIITFTRNTLNEPAKILKLYTIFEEGEITERYSFSRSSPYNPYIRLVQCFGKRISAEINNKNNFTLRIKIK